MKKFDNFITYNYFFHYSIFIYAKILLLNSIPKLSSINLKGLKVPEHNNICLGLKFNIKLNPIDASKQ